MPRSLPGLDQLVFSREFPTSSPWGFGALEAPGESAVTMFLSLGTQREAERSGIREGMGGAVWDLPLPLASMSLLILWLLH